MAVVTLLIWSKNGVLQVAYVFGLSFWISGIWVIEVKCKNELQDAAPKMDLI